MWLLKPQTPYNYSIISDVYPLFDFALVTCLILFYPSVYHGLRGDVYQILYTLKLTLTYHNNTYVNIVATKVLIDKPWRESMGDHREMV